MPSPAGTFRDPVHGYIDVYPHERDIIDTSAFQRLRWIHQLGLTSYVYHGAEHSRFGHSLGVMHLAGRFTERLLEKHKNLVMDRLSWHSEEEFEQNKARLILEARLSGLLHDIGHGPFSHVGEDTLFPTGKRHEDYSAEIITSPQLGIAEVIDSQLRDRGVTTESVANVIRGGVYRAGFVQELISGPLDVDKMDYLLRDSLYCGVEYGKYDIGRLIDTLALYDEDPSGSLKLGLDDGGIQAVEGFILARYFMFTQVYLHDVRRSFDFILTDFIREFLSNRFKINRYPEDLKQYLSLNDNVVMAEAQTLSDEQSKNLAWRLVSRQHFKAVYESESHPDRLVANKALFQLPNAIMKEYPTIAVWSDRASVNPATFTAEPLPVRQGDSWKSLDSLSRVLQNLPEVNLIRVYADVRGDASLEAQVGSFCNNFLS